MRAGTDGTNPWLTPADAARLLGISPRSLLRFIRSGYLRGWRKVSGRWVILLEDFERDLERLRDLLHQEQAPVLLRPHGPGRPTELWRALRRRG